MFIYSFIYSFIYLLIYLFYLFIYIFIYLFIYLSILGACAGYTYLYAVWYNITELDMNGIVPMILYSGYMSIFSITVFLVTGTIGFFACFWFNLQIYGSIKVD